jgi:hypothetical protein
MTDRAARRYKKIIKEDGASPTTTMKKLFIAEAFKNCSLEILSRIIQLRTGNGDIGVYLQKRKVPRNDTTESAASSRL